MLTLLHITDATGQVVEPSYLAAAEAVHRELRQEKLAVGSEYLKQMHRVFVGGGRMLVAISDGAVVGVAVYRIYENTFAGMQMYVDDLVTTQNRRSTGVGQLLLHELQACARRHHCTELTLDSGTQRKRAHQFYLREKMEIDSFHFSMRL